MCTSQTNTTHVLFLHHLLVFFGGIAILIFRVRGGANTQGMSFQSSPLCHLDEHASLIGKHVTKRWKNHRKVFVWLEQADLYTQEDFHRKHTPKIGDALGRRMGYHLTGNVNSHKKNPMPQALFYKPQGNLIDKQVINNCSCMGRSKWPNQRNLQFAQAIRDLFQSGRCTEAFVSTLSMDNGITSKHLIDARLHGLGLKQRTEMLNFGV